MANQETRWEGEDRMDKEKYSMLYGGKNKKVQNGTTFFVDRVTLERITQNVGE